MLSHSAASKSLINTPGDDEALKVKSSLPSLSRKEKKVTIERLKVERIHDRNERKNG